MLLSPEETWMMAPSTPEPEEEVIIAEIPPKKKAVPNVMIKKKTAKKPKVDPRDEPRPTTYGDVVTAKAPPVAAPKVEEKPAPAPEQPKEVAKAKDTAKVAKVPKKKEVVKTLAIPYIRPKVKRTSVLKLQEVLKVKGTYKNSLDGYYGAGTKKGYEDIMANNKDIQKYKLLAKMYQEEANNNSTLQDIIYGMDSDVAAGVSRLQSQRSAISKAYQAYGIYALSGQNKKTDKLMNEALKASFSNKKFKNKAPFDFKKTYSYNDYGQLIKHMRYTIQDCGNIMAWESLSLLETVIKEMTPDLSKIDSKTLAKTQSERAGLLLYPTAQSLEDYKAIDSWNTKLWSGLAKWEAKDPLHAKMLTPLKVSYFKSWTLLEDHLMNKGLKAKEARGVSLSILKTIVEPYLAGYSD